MPSTICRRPSLNEDAVKSLVRSIRPSTRYVDTRPFNGIVQGSVRTFILVNVNPPYRYTGKFGILNSGSIQSRSRYFKNVSKTIQKVSKYVWKYKTVSKMC